MATVLRGSVFVPVPIERAWDLWVDAARYPQWQGGLLAVRDLSGPVSVAGSTYVLDHGPKLTRRAKVVAAERPVRHVLEQDGIGIHDESTATFEPEGDGTRLTVVIVGHLNAVMRLLSKIDRQDRRSNRELQRELDRFAAIATRTAPAARTAARYVALAGGVRRRLTVLAVDDDRVHIRLHPGHLRDQDPDDVTLTPPKPPSDQMDLWPINPPVRASVDVWASGLPFLRRDGGQGLDHVALSTDAWADAAPRETGEDPVSDDDRAAIDAWRREGGPTVGVDADLELAPLCTLRFGGSPEVGELWGVAKVLRSEILKVHLALYENRWSMRPDRVTARELVRRPIDIEAYAVRDSWATRIPGDVLITVGHVPLSRSGFSAAKPRFAGVATLTNAELEGYRMWRDANGGTFDAFQPFAGFAEADPDT